MRSKKKAERRTLLRNLEYPPAAHATRTPTPAHSPPHTHTLKIVVWCCVIARRFRMGNVGASNPLELSLRFGGSAAILHGRVPSPMLPKKKSLQHLPVLVALEQEC